MKRFLLFLILMTSIAKAGPMKPSREIGLGMGAVSPYPLSSSPYALMAVLEGTYRWKWVGLSIIATATSSPSINGTYWFGPQYGYQQTFLEPRLYLSFLRLGFAVGVNLDSRSGQLQSVVSYGPMAGIEIPMGGVSLGTDVRYIFTSGANPAPLAGVFMFRFRF